MQEYKAIIVEGKSDKEHLEKVLAEEVDIYCTYGTANEGYLEGLLEPKYYHEIFILTDADFSGERLRASLRVCYPQAKHLFTRRVYREVARTPLDELAKLLARSHFQVLEEYLR